MKCSDLLITPTITPTTLSHSCQCSPLPSQFGLLNIQLKDLQKQVTTISAEKAGMTRERDEGRAELAKLQAKLQASALQVGGTGRYAMNFG